MIIVISQFKRGVDEKSEYPYTIYQKKNLISPSWRNFDLLRFEYKQGTYRVDKYIKILGYLDRLCFIYQLDALTCIRN